MLTLPLDPAHLLRHRSASIHLSILPSVHPSICPSIRLLVGIDRTLASPYREGYLFAFAACQAFNFPRCCPGALPSLGYPFWCGLEGPRIHDLRWLCSCMLKSVFHQSRRPPHDRLVCQRWQPYRHREVHRCKPQEARGSGLGPLLRSGCTLPTT